MKKASAMKNWPVLPMLAVASPAYSQESTEVLDQKVAERLDMARQAYGVPDPRLRCRPKPGSDEIVVCVDRGEDQQVERDAPDLNTLEGRRALDGGIPRAPQFDRGSCRGQPGCVTGGWAPPPVYYIDMKAIPEPPPGSDADKIAKGEMRAP